MSDKFFIGGIDGYYTTSAAVTIGVKGEKGDGDRKYAHYPIAACRNNDGGLEIGVYLPQQVATLQAAVPFLRVVHSDGLVCCWNAEAAASAYAGSCFTPHRAGPLCLSFEEWCEMIVDYLASMVSDGSTLPADTYLSMLASLSLPWSSPADELADLPAVCLRYIAAVHQISPASVKKADVVEAIVQHIADLKLGGVPSWYGLEDYTPLKRTGEVGPMYPFIGDCRHCGVFLHRPTGNVVVDTMGSNGITSNLATECEEALQANNKRQLNGSKRLGRPILSHVDTMISNFKNDGSVAVANLYQFNPSMATTLNLVLEITESGEAAMLESKDAGIRAVTKEFSALTSEVKVLRSAVAAMNQSPPNQELADGQHEVDITGVWFKHEGSVDAPQLLMNYSLNYWRAEQRLGRGSSVVEFDAADLADSILNDRIVSLIGPPGTGKTSVVTQIGATLGIPVYVIQFTKEKPVESLIGCDKIINGQQVWVDGEITAALRYAATSSTRVIIVLDERDHADPSVQSELHSVLEGRPIVLPGGTEIGVGPNVSFVMTSNTSGHGDTTGRHSAANMSDSAFNSRVKATFNVSYLRKEDEVGLLVMYGLDVDEADEIVNFARATRSSVERMDSGEAFEGMSEAVCLRHLIGYAQCRARGVDQRKAIASTIIAALPSSDRLVANELVIEKVQF
jgi:hypothetical protein